MATQGIIGALLVQLVVIAAVAGAAEAQQRPQQAAPAPAKSAPVPAATKAAQTAPRAKTSDSDRVAELNRLDCSRAKCSGQQDFVCATGRGIAGCSPPEQGCTYTNGCLARCVYGATVAHLGECTHKGAMRIVENQAPPQRACQCDTTFKPVCSKSSECTIPGGCTHASECYAKCAGSTDIRQGACPGDKGH